MMRKLLALAGLLVIAATTGGCARPDRAEPPVTSAAGVTSSTAASPASSLGSVGSGWGVFVSAVGGYRLRYPPGWRVRESSGTGGPVLSLLPPRGAGISLLVSFSAPPDPAGLATTRCRPVRVGGLVGRRCLERRSRVVTATLKGRDRWLVLTTSLRRPAPPAGAYDGVLASLRLT